MTPRLAERIEHWPLTRLKPYARNARTHSPAQVDKIVRSIQAFGFTNPILVDGAEGILAGHGRLQAAQKLGLPAVPVIVLDHLSEAERRAYILADNKLALDAGWDDDLLAAELREIQAMDFDLTLSGFDDKELERMLGAPDDPRADECPEAPETPATRRGDLWLLGRHRLLCGDATSADDVARLMDGRKADMVFTDPPYGLGGYAGRSGKHSAVIGDDLPLDQLERLLTAIPSAAQRFIWCEWSNYPTFVQAIGIPDHLIVWAKPWPGMGSGYRRQHEFCLHFGAYEATDQFDLWNVTYASEGVYSTWQRTAKCSLHPTQKPVALAEKAITNHRPAIVVDTFLGSGSTLIACEKTNRVCLGLELAPTYCDVIVNRWQEYIGGAATLDGDGRAFAEIREERLEQCPQ